MPVLVDIPKDITAKVTEYIPEELENAQGRFLEKNSEDG